MHNTLQDHYHKDPQHRFPHIPSIPVRVPVAISTQMSLCYSSRYLQQQLVITREDIRTTTAALLDAVRQIEFDSNAQTIQQTNQEDGRKRMRKFFIKRNYSACALIALTFILRSLSSWLHSRPSLPSAQQPSNTSNSNGKSLRESQFALPNVPCSCGSTDAAKDMDDVLHNTQQLFKAAERIARSPVERSGLCSLVFQTWKETSTGGPGHVQNTSAQLLGNLPTEERATTSRPGIRNT
ncbi:TPA: hypothetical protein ACH3X1_015685 [Trebouxia sp. C0004]